MCCVGTVHFLISRFFLNYLYANIIAEYMYLIPIDNMYTHTGSRAVVYYKINTLKNAGKPCYSNFI